MTQIPDKKDSIKPGLHSRNRHNRRYDFTALQAAHPPLEPFVRRNKYDNLSIEFANPAAVKALNTALLIHHYDLNFWDLPVGYLCPPIPGRADYIHYVADLLAEYNGGEIPKGANIRVLDIGVGANCIYPIIGHKEYGWSFVGTEIDEVAIKAVAHILSVNPDLEKVVEIRAQTRPERMFRGIIEADEHFDLCVCNPPFHRSAKAAWEGTQKKWSNLGTGKGKGGVRNFGGKQHELSYKGGEIAFIKLMIKESSRVSESVDWFTTMVSKKENLRPIYQALKKVEATEIKTIQMAQGQKASRIVAWTFALPKTK
ncbi:MAG TPA: 23S rRNA (adenine(1618)-N(6))-methyltransferase RlmF [Bacteroidetes bacterium]|nr:23S rRNA (adenine(1618)-N(6))-methyltransferase RlmF [Bacteroidota bacterium]